MVQQWDRFAELEAELLAAESPVSYKPITAQEYISWVQRSLIRHLGTRLPINGQDSQIYRDAVRLFQRNCSNYVPGCKLSADGDVGRKTQDMLILANESSTSYMVWVQKALRSMGANLVVTGKKTSQTKEWLQKVQGSAGLDKNGFVGAKTERVLMLASRTAPPVTPTPSRGTTLPPGVSPILEFRAITVQPIGLRALGTGFRFGGRFRVILRLDPTLDCSRFEYRQLIRGTATIQPGRFTSSLPSLASWVPTGPACNASLCFQIPGGLPTRFTEDAQIVGGSPAASTPAGHCCGGFTGGRTERFGHRSSPGVKRTGLEDLYLPTQASGCNYRALDTYGLRGASRISGTRFTLRIVWQGRVIDTADRNRVIDTIHWGVRGDDVIV